MQAAKPSSQVSLAALLQSIEDKQLNRDSAHLSMAQHLGRERTDWHPTLRRSGKWRLDTTHARSPDARWLRSNAQELPHGSRATALTFGIIQLTQDYAWTEISPLTMQW